MARTVKYLMNEVSELEPLIQQIIKHSGFENYGDLSELDFDKTSANDLFIVDELYKILDKLTDISSSINYLNRPITAEGVLHKNKNGRYEFNDIELSCGYVIEYLSTDNRPKWITSRIEHNGTDYYIVDNKDITLEGLHVRIRL